MRDQRGFTTVELLVAMLIGIIVISAAGDLLVTTTRGSVQLADRVDSTARARLAVDRVVRDLQGQVCLSPTQPPIIAANGRSVTFTADLSGVAGTSAPPTKVQIVYDPAAETLTRTTWTGTGAPPATTFPAAPTSSQVVIDGALAPADGRIFHFFAYNGTPPALALTEVGPGTDPATVVPAADRARIVRVAVSIGARPANRADSDPQRSFVTDDAWVGTAEGDETNPSVRGPQCDVD